MHTLARGSKAVRWTGWKEKKCPKAKTVPVMLRLEELM